MFYSCDYKRTSERDLKFGENSYYRKRRQLMRKILYHYGNKNYVRRMMRSLRFARGRLY